MTTLAHLLSNADRERLRERQRLLEREAELRELDRQMRTPGSLAAPGEPVPLHRAGRGGTPEEPHR